MGRGRQKAKQMKVARKLKYFSPDTDLHALQRELADEDSYAANAAADEPEEDDAIDDDLYSKYADFANIPAEDDDIDPKQLDESFWTGGSSTKYRLKHHGGPAPVRRFGAPAPGSTRGRGGGAARPSGRAPFALSPRGRSRAAAPPPPSRPSCPR